MKTFLYSLIFFVIIGLGLFGLLASFLDNPSALLVQFLIVAIVAAVGLLLFRRLAEGMSSGEQALYKKAAKHSSRRYKSRTTGRKTRLSSGASKLKVISSDGSRRQTHALAHPNPKNHGHLTVIDGKKNKKKKRVLF